jgi:ribose transport system substrate-binding protein
MKKISLVVALLLIIALVFSACGGGGGTDTADPAPADTAPAETAPAETAPADTGGGGDLPVMGISTGSSGTSWRDIMIAGIEEVGQDLVATGKIASYKVVNNVTNGDATEQANILRDFISEGVDIIVVNPNSPDALNGVIAEAQAAGILVLSADATVTAADVVNVTLDHYAWNTKNVEFIAETLQAGTAIQVYGLDGHPANNDRIEATDDVLANYPDINLIASTTGGWDQTPAKEVTLQILGGGQEVDAVITQDGMAFGALSAFQDLGKLPKVMFGDPGTAFFKVWNELREEGADFKACAQPNPPGIVGTGMRVAINLYEGKEFNDGVLDGSTFFYKVGAFFTDDNFDEAWAVLKDQPDDYLLTEILSQSEVDALFK